MFEVASNRSVMGLVPQPSGSARSPQSEATWPVEGLMLAASNLQTR